MRRDWNEDPARGRHLSFNGARPAGPAGEDSGFTLVEVLVALLLGTIGLLGTLAVQQTVISASKAANDSAVALRLASQRLEEFSTMLTTGSRLNPDSLPHVDQMQDIAQIPPGEWSAPDYLNVEGATYPTHTVAVAATAAAAGFRWTRRWRVVNLAVALPYVISVVVTYANDTGTPKTVRLDMERKKSW
jgi:prepilin-type N-terminal cleavage/methylation domain-containing protein